MVFRQCVKYPLKSHVSFPALQDLYEIFGIVTLPDFFAFSTRKFSYYNFVIEHTRCRIYAIMLSRYNPRLNHKEGMA